MEIYENYVVMKKKMRAPVIIGWVLRDRASNIKFGKILLVKRCALAAAAWITRGTWKINQWYQLLNHEI